MLRRLLPLLVFLALGGLLFAGIQLSKHEDPGVLPSPLIGKRAPAFALPDLLAPGRIVRNSDLAGAPYVLNVWGSWCVNCQEEHPVVSTLAKSGIVKVVGYNYHEVDPGDAPRWLAQFGNPYALIVSDVDGRTALDWGIYGAPETFLVDARGIVRWKHVGGLTAAIVHDELLPLLSTRQVAR
ncbi:MAG TPA: DsbE family thiol:disulfide interchange protein [Xanthomonadaceae bacterium]|jgi:cytochrome c biogenesis protein CcmG/thiol:disulfide interchange protein DsbE|nr:DsbE family thiol:disulfide interchange protein [Xanthomonadaceae bacterium]